MAEPDVDMPLTLPDTQNAADALLTQSQEITSQNQVIWGRLFPNSSRFKQLGKFTRNFQLETHLLLKKIVTIIVCCSL